MDENMNNNSDMNIDPADSMDNGADAGFNSGDAGENLNADVNAGMSGEVHDAEFVSFGSAAGTSGNGSYSTYGTGDGTNAGNGAGQFNGYGTYAAGNAGQGSYNAENGNNEDEPGKNAAVTSLILGIIGVACFIFGYTSIASLVLGVIGLVFASNSKKAGFNGSIRTAGFILSVISVIGGALFFVACVACVGIMGAAGVSSSMMGINMF